MEKVEKNYSMNFIINDVITFNEKGNAIYATTGPRRAVLISSHASRLLSELLDKKGEILTHDYLVKKIWTDVNLTPSKSSLYNTISELRKAINQIDESQTIILTIPKYGFKIEEKTRVLSRSNLYKKKIITAIAYTWIFIALSFLFHCRKERNIFFTDGNSGLLISESKCNVVVVVKDDFYSNRKKSELEVSLSALDKKQVCDKVSLGTVLVPESEGEDKEDVKEEISFIALCYTGQSEGKLLKNCKSFRVQS